MKSELNWEEEGFIRCGMMGLLTGRRHNWRKGVIRSIRQKRPNEDIL